MEYHLAIETSSSPSSIALLNGTQLIQEKTIEVQQQTSALLGSHASGLLKDEGITPKDLKWVSVSMGPGSYTGLRVGLSLAKGLCYALNIPLVPVSSLKAVAHSYLLNSNPEDGMLLPIFDARKGNVYSATYTNKLEVVQKPNRYQLKELISTLDIKEKWHIITPNRSKIDIFDKSKYIVEILEINAHCVGLLSVKEHKKTLSEDIAYLNPTYIINNYF